MKVTGVVILLSFSVLANAAAIAAPISAPSAVTEATPLDNGKANDVRGEVEGAYDLATDEVLDDDDESYPGITARGNVEDITILERDIVPVELEKRDSLLERGLAMLERRETAQEATDRLEFETAMDSFLSAKQEKNPETLIWTDDGCSKSSDRPSGFNFLHSCQRHDFGYRNYKEQGRFTSANREKLDDQFKSDLYAECNKHGLIKKTVCKSTADIYYHSVRALGGL